MPGLLSDIPLASLAGQSPELFGAISKARTTGVLLNVLDESLARSAELRERRQAEEAERRQIEERIRRREETEEIERRDAQRVSDEADLRRALAEEREALDVADERGAALARAEAQQAEQSLRHLDILA